MTRHQKKLIAKIWQLAAAMTVVCWIGSYGVCGVTRACGDCGHHGDEDDGGTHRVEPSHAHHDHGDSGTDSHHEHPQGPQSDDSDEACCASLISVTAGKDMLASTMKCMPWSPVLYLRHAAATPGLLLPANTTLFARVRLRDWFFVPELCLDPAHPSLAPPSSHL